MQWWLELLGRQKGHIECSITILLWCRVHFCSQLTSSFSHQWDMSSFMFSRQYFDDGKWLIKKSIWAIEARKWQGLGQRHIGGVIFILRHQFHSSCGPHVLSFSTLGAFFVYFKGGVLVILITPYFNWSLYLVIVPWGHASEGFV